jgi:hypothetical protein
VARATQDPRGGWNFELDDGSSRWAAGPAADNYAAELGAAIQQMPDQRLANNLYYQSEDPYAWAPGEAPRGHPDAVAPAAPAPPPMRGPMGTGGAPGSPEDYGGGSSSYREEDPGRGGSPPASMMPADPQPVAPQPGPQQPSTNPADYTDAPRGGQQQQPGGGGGGAIRIPGGRQTAGWNMQYRQVPEEAREAMLSGLDSQAWAAQMRLQNQAKFRDQETKQAQATAEADQYQREMIIRKQQEREKKLAERRDVLQQAQEEAANMDVSEESYWREKGTGARVLAAIATAGGAFASGLTGAPNYAMQIIDQQIERNIQAQKEKKAGAGKAADAMRWDYAELRNQFGSEHEADLAMRASFLTSAEHAARRRAAMAENEDVAAGSLEIAGLLQAQRGQIMAELDSVAITQQDVNVPDQVIPLGGGGGGAMTPKMEEEARKGAQKFLEDSEGDLEASDSLDQFRANQANNPQQSGATGVSGAVSRLAESAGVDDVVLPEQYQENRRVERTAVLNVAKARYGTASDRTVKVVAPTVGTSPEARRNWAEGHQRVVDSKVMARLRNEPDHVRQQIFRTSPTARAIWERNGAGGAAPTLNTLNYAGGGSQ